MFRVEIRFTIPKSILFSTQSTSIRMQKLSQAGKAAMVRARVRARVRAVAEIQVLGGARWAIVSAVAKAAV